MFFFFFEELRNASDGNNRNNNAAEGWEMKRFYIELVCSAGGWESIVVASVGNNWFRSAAIDNIYTIYTIYEVFVAELTALNYSNSVLISSCRRTIDCSAWWISKDFLLFYDHKLHASFWKLRKYYITDSMHIYTLYILLESLISNSPFHNHVYNISFIDENSPTKSQNKLIKNPSSSSSRWKLKKKRKRNNRPSNYHRCSKIPPTLTNIHGALIVTPQSSLSLLALSLAIPSSAIIQSARVKPT